jgi:mono/diheme cytochrome c family protein
MKYVLTIVITISVLGAGALLYSWLGVYNIAATKPHWDITSSFIRMLRDRSVSVHSNDIRVPDLDDPELKQTAFSHYHAMCRLCHGAPGYPPEEFAIGLYPAPPSLTSGNIKKARSNAEIYWIVKHGFKMTGMPAFDPTHEEEDLWSLVSLVQEVPQMSAERYGELARASSDEETGHGHTHGELKEDEDHGHDRSDSLTHDEAEQNHH